jgi:hypothetical protein
MAAYLTYGSDSSEGVDVSLHIIHEPPQGTAGWSTPITLLLGYFNAYRFNRRVCVIAIQYNKIPNRSTSPDKGMGT